MERNTVYEHGDLMGPKTKFDVFFNDQPPEKFPLRSPWGVETQQGDRCFTVASPLLLTTQVPPKQFLVPHCGVVG